MKTINLLKKLESYPFFTENDFSKIVNKSSEYTRTFLYRLRKKKLIKRIERGKYTCHADPIIFASHLQIPSYISLWSALKYYGLIQQQPFDVFIIVKKPRKTIVFDNTKIRFIKTKHFFGYKKERYSDFDIFIADREKTIIDCILNKIAFDEATNIIKKENIDVKKLVEYAKRTKNKTLIKRIGYLLETFKGNSFGLKPSDNNYSLLNPINKKKGTRNKKWRLIINYDNQETA